MPDTDSDSSASVPSTPVQHCGVAGRSLDVPLSSTDSNSNSQVRAILERVSGRVYAFRSHGIKVSREDADREAEQGRTSSVRISS